MALHIWNNHEQFDWAEAQAVCNESMKGKLGTRLQKEFKSNGEPLKDFTGK